MTLHVNSKRSLSNFMSGLSDINCYCSIEPVRRVIDEALAKLVAIDDDIDHGETFRMDESIAVPFYVGSEKP